MTAFNTIVQNVLIRLSMYSGLDSQTYGQGPIELIVRDTFDDCFNKFWWAAYTTFGEVMTLDGATGVVTTDLTNKIRRFGDIHSVYYEQTNRPLPVAPVNTNQSQIRARSLQPITGEKIFRVIPVTTTGVVSVNYRTYPLAFDDDTEILLDSGMLEFGACAAYLEDDASNPAAADKYRAMYDQRFNQLTNNENQFGHSMNSSTQLGLFEWTDA